ncbi:MAG: TonB-dependent receptor, partial [Acidobacteriaceae bacterium]|nr:TonB-dependent receptor [Acidobacteriaceae bacterium]
GTELRAEDERDAFAVNTGTYNFINNTTSIPGFASAGQLGYGFASFFLGTPSQISRTGFAPPRLTKTGYRALYAQDDWRISPKFTLNLGLRWDVALPAWSNSGFFSTFDPTVPNPGAGNLPGSIVYAGTSGGPCISEGGASLCRPKIANTYYNFFQPRVGFAYRLTDATVLRAGFGISTLRGGASTLMGPEIAASYLTGYQYQETLASPDNGYTVPTQIGSTWDAGIPPVGPAPARTRTIANGQPVQYMRPEDGKPGYVQTWSFTVERRLPWRVGLEGSYVGSSSVRIGANLLNPNQVPSQYLSLGPLLLADINSPQAVAAGIRVPYSGFTGTVAQALRPFPQFLTITDNTQNTGHQNYHSLQLRAQKYFSDGLTFLVSYTWSKTLTDSVDQFSTFGAFPLDTANWRAEKRVLGGTLFNPASPRTLSIASTYELPIGPGKKLLAQSGPVGKIVGGWGLSAVLTYNAGAVPPISGGTANPIFNGPSRPNVVLGVNPKLYSGGSFDPATQLYLNPNAFSDAGAFALGNASPTLANATGFPYYNENVSLIKDTKIGEFATVQFRAEAFNIFNRVVFANPDTNWNDRVTGAFGKVTGQANSPRVLQLALRVDF